jgi:SOS-response transcriptional repressor LexA
MLAGRTDTIYRFIHEYVQRRGFPPTLREIAASCGISTTGVLPHLEWLTKRGYITRREGVPRSIHLLDATQTQQRILRYIRDVIEKHGYPPNVTEIAAGCHLHPSTVQHYLQVLREQRLIAYRDRHIRSMRLLMQDAKVG